jgi:hypothetical protein
MLNTLDIFGQEFKIKVSNRDSHKTLFGGIVSILTLILGFTVTCYFVIMLLERKEMQVINSEDLNYYPKNSFQDYPIRVALYAPNGNSIPFDGSVFNVIVMQTYSNYSNTQLLNTKRTTMSMVNCTEKHTKNYLTLVPERAPYEKCVDAKNLEVVGYDGFKLKLIWLLFLLLVLIPHLEANVGLNRKLIHLSMGLL